MDFATPRAKLEFDTILQRVTRYASSKPGADLLRSLRIKTSPQEISEELSTVSEMKSLIEADRELPTEGIFPIEPVLQKSLIEGVILAPQEILQVALTERAARLVRSFLVKHAESTPKLWLIAEQLSPDKVLEFNIGKTIDEQGAIRADASKELRNIRRSIDDAYATLRRKLGEVLRRVSDRGFSQEEIITTREGRMVIPVKSEHKNQVAGFVHSASASGATVFIEPTETLDLNNDIRSFFFQEQREINRLLLELTLQIRERQSVIATNLTLLARLDSLQAKAKHSIEILGCAPTINQSDCISLFGARHPLLLQTHGYKNTVPLDISIGGEFTTLIISGPNAGGKSVAMKCVGLLVLMTQAGLHIPVGENSLIRVFETFFVDIGDDQSIENDLSTFSSHLRNLKEISESANQNSLVLIDEIGSGTDPAEGSVIAAAFLELMTTKKILTMATTHHSSLKLFAHDTPGVENGAMEFDQQSLSPTYKFRVGVPGSSYAIQLAERHGFSPELLARTKEMLGESHSKVDELLIDLESKTLEYERDLETIRSEKRNLGDLVRKYEEKNRNHSKELQALRKQAVDGARGLLEQASSLIQQTVKEIREKGASSDSIKSAEQSVRNLKEDLSKESKDLHFIDREVFHFDEGSFVLHEGSGNIGQISEINTTRDIATVHFGAVRMKVDISELRPAEEKPKADRLPTSTEPDQRDVQRELDLRGLTGDEAVPLVDGFIDKAILHGLHRIDIIHGKGTGALRKKIAEFLSTHARVKSYRLGEWNEGGAGATVVELRDED